MHYKIFINNCLVFSLVLFSTGIVFAQAPDKHALLDALQLLRLPANLSTAELWRTLEARCCDLPDSATVDSINQLQEDRYYRDAALKLGLKATSSKEEVAKKMVENELDSNRKLYGLPASSTQDDVNAAYRKRQAERHVLEEQFGTDFAELRKRLLELDRPGIARSIGLAPTASLEQIETAEHAILQKQLSKKFGLKPNASFEEINNARLTQENRMCFETALKVLKADTSSDIAKIKADMRVIALALEPARADGISSAHYDGSPHPTLQKLLRWAETSSK